MILPQIWQLVNDMAWPTTMNVTGSTVSGIDLHAWHQYRVLVLFIAVFSVLVVRSIPHLKARFSTVPSHNHNKPRASLPDPSVAAHTKLDVKKHKVEPKRVIGSRPRRKVVVESDAQLKVQPKIFYFSLNGATEKRAQQFSEDLGEHLSRHSPAFERPELHNIAEIDFEDYFVSTPKSDSDPALSYFYLLLLPTYNIDTILETFIEHLKETHHDFRIDTASLSGLAGYSVFGFGDGQGWESESEGFCSQAVEVDKWMAKLTGGKRAFPLGTGDVKGAADERLREWGHGVRQSMKDLVENGCLGEGVPGSGAAVESDDEDLGDVDNKEQTGVTRASGNVRTKPTELGDLEDIRGTPESQETPLAIDFTTTKDHGSAPQPPKEMVAKSSPTYAALTKQGYAIIGSHSGVKICRWTKSALRGRGSCYKYSFYGIKSHLCMETTPSLSCSNKCVFCWRHGTNPVGTTWRWQVDPPDMIFAGAKEAHLKKIKMLRGVPGLRAERFQEAMRIRHCALSLVGEPIFYPHINEFVSLLHSERISSFLVCNAQHPEHLEALRMVTQLYVSIDASNKASLKKVDRPLHRDFWDRFLRCLDIIRKKRFRMRTVFRLTLVKGFNVEDEVEGYADLVARGLPCFIEIKGVTYCGTSTSAGAGLTMHNVPFYAEVVAFVEALNEALARRGLDYGIAAEHAHSCCVLLGSRRFFLDGKWHTLIDYDRFFACLESGQDFAPEDYIGPPTPEWATWGRGGFSPEDDRVDRKGRKLLEV